MTICGVPLEANPGPFGQLGAPPSPPAEPALPALPALPPLPAVASVPPLPLLPPLLTMPPPAPAAERPASLPQPTPPKTRSKAKIADGLRRETMVTSRHPRPPTFAREASGFAEEEVPEALLPHDRAQDRRQDLIVLGEVLVGGLDRQLLGLKIQGPPLVELEPLPQVPTRRPSSFLVSLALPVRPGSSQSHSRSFSPTTLQSIEPLLPA